MTCETYQQSILDGGVAWDQRNVLEYVQLDPNADATNFQGLHGEVAKKGYLISWGHINGAMFDITRHPVNRRAATFLISAQRQ